MTSFKEVEKLHDITSTYKRKCSCGHSVSTLPIHVYKKDFVICTWCGKKVFKDIEKQTEHDEKLKKEDFRLKLMNAMCKKKRSSHVK